MYELNNNIHIHQKKKNEQKGINEVFCLFLRISKNSRAF